MSAYGHTFRAQTRTPVRAVFFSAIACLGLCLIAALATHPASAQLLDDAEPDAADPLPLATEQRAADGEAAGTGLSGEMATSDLGYEFELAEGWQVATEGDRDATIAQLYSDLGSQARALDMLVFEKSAAIAGGYVPSIVIVTDSTSFSATGRDRELCVQMLERDPQTTVLSSGLMTAGKRSCIRIESETDGDPRSRFWSYIFEAEGGSLVVTCVAPRDQADIYGPRFDAMMRTFDIPGYEPTEPTGTGDEGKFILIGGLICTGIIIVPGIIIAVIVLFVKRSD